MAGKRIATSNLNHTNWDEDDEVEEAGTFKKASNAVIQKRVIKTAKRRNPISTAYPSVDSASKNLFSGFTGFAKTTPALTTLGVLNNISKSPESESKSNGLSSLKQSSSVMFKDSDKETQSTEKEDEYYAKLKGLNESVSMWIKKHVDTNPFLNLKPIFKDYEKYFDELEKSRTEDKTNLSSSALTTSKENIFSPSVQKELGGFVFKVTGTVGETSTESSKASVPLFAFGVKSVESGAAKIEETPAATTASQAINEVTQVTPQFTFGVVPTTSAPTFSFGSPKTSAAGFSFGSSTSTPISFTNVSNTPSKPEKENQDAKVEGDKKGKDEGANEDDEPPKVEFTPVLENEFVYTIRCKVFVKKENNYGDRGVGNLYLKKVPSSNKIQLIVRADTNLGNLLCNFILSDSIPIKRMGKKDVMLVCIPTPEAKPPPVPILLRVKSTEEAEALFTELEKYKT